MPGRFHGGGFGMHSAKPSSRKAGLCWLLQLREPSALFFLVTTPTVRLSPRLRLTDAGERWIVGGEPKGEHPKRWRRTRIIAVTLLGASLDLLFPRP